MEQNKVSSTLLYTRVSMVAGNVCAYICSSVCIEFLLAGISTLTTIIFCLHIIMPTLDTIRPTLILQAYIYIGWLFFLL